SKKNHPANRSARSIRGGQFVRDDVDGSHRPDAHRCATQTCNLTDIAKRECRDVEDLVARKTELGRIEDQISRCLLHVLRAGKKSVRRVEDRLGFSEKT